MTYIITTHLSPPKCAAVSLKTYDNFTFKMDYVQ